MKESSFVFHKRRLRRPFLVVVALLAIASVAAAAQNLVFQLDPQHTAINYTLGDVLHTVRGTFRLRQGSLRWILPRAS